MSYRNLLLLFAATAVSYACYVRAEQNPFARYVADGFSKIDRYALEEAPDEELFNGAMHGMVAVLHKYGDQHSEFIDAKQQAAFNEEYDQEFGGVGIRLRMLGKPKAPTVIGLPEPGTPAAGADIRLGDQIEAVDGQPTAGRELEDVTTMVRGPVGESVTLTIRRPGASDTHTVTIERAVINVESILGDVREKNGRWNYLIHENPRIGYMRVRMFGDKTATEFAKILEELTREPLEGLIIDVRDDAGGSFDAAVKISDLFLRAGEPIVTTQERDGTVRDRFMSTGTGRYLDLPLVVLVDHNSASASEIVAACLQDYGRAKIIGERSYGKGTVQRLMRVESGHSVLKLTTATYLRPTEKNIHRGPDDGPEDEWGVKPDAGFEVKLDEPGYKTWMTYRQTRDLMGDGAAPGLAAELSQEDGAVPTGYVDEALRRAVDYLEGVRGER